MNATWPKKYFQVIIVLLFIASIMLVNRVLHPHQDINKLTLNLEMAKLAFDQANQLEDGQSGVKQVYDSSGKLLGLLALSHPHAQGIIGFGGEIPLLISLDQNFNLTKITLLDNAESPDFIENIIKEGFFKNFENKNIAKIQQEKIDAVSGATLSSNAITQTIRTRLSSLIPQETIQTTTYFEFSKSKKLLSLLAFAFSISIFFLGKKMKRFQTLSLILNIVFLGFINGHFLSLATLYNWTTHGIIFQAMPIFITILVSSLLVNFFTSKNFYCTYVCPFGSFQTLIKKGNKKSIALPGKIINILKPIRAIYLLSLLYLLILGFEQDLTRLEPFSAFLYRVAPLSATIMASLFLTISFFIPKSWCRFFCPTGYIIDFITIHRRK